MSRSTSTLVPAEFSVIEKVLKMESGYVLDFLNPTFSKFFGEFDVDIDADSYQARGTSKANRLRVFLRDTRPDLVSRVLRALRTRVELGRAGSITQEDLDAYDRIVTRLESGKGAPASTMPPASPAAEALLLARVFRPEVFARLPGDSKLHAALVARMREAQRCVEHEAWLSAVILSGSVLEGMALGFGTAQPERVNRAYVAQYGKPAPRLSDWKLHEWITVLTRLRAFSPNVEKFGHALRDFRNYVHPAEQLAHGFSPDGHTARISFHVVQAAAEDLVRFCEGDAP